MRRGRAHAGLVTLRLDSNNLASAVPVIAAQLAQSMPALQELTLSNNSLSDESGTALARMLLPTAAWQLTHLDLSANPSLATAACQKLAQAMPYARALAALDLSKTHVGALLRSSTPV